MQNESKPKEISLSERLEQIRSSPKLQSQQQTGVVLSAVEDTLRDQKSEFTPTAYFAALLSLLNQYISSVGAIVNKHVASAVVYLLDLITPHVPPPLLRSKFGTILTSLSPALSHADADAPFLRSSIGCLVALLTVQDAQAWALSQNQVGPRKATAGLLTLAVDHRPKVRKRAQEGLTTVLQNGPPNPSLDHPAADMCAETAIQSFGNLARNSGQPKASTSNGQSSQREPGLVHAMQLIKTVATASGGWPSRSIDSLCEVLFTVARSKSEYLTMAAFDAFEAIFEGMANSRSFDALPRLLKAVAELQPARDDSQLLPPWIAIISRGYDVSAQIDPKETFQILPDLSRMISVFLTSSSYNVRVSAAECLISFFVNCIPSSVILEPSIYDEKTLENLGIIVTDLLSVQYQSAWMEVFGVLGAMLDTLRWRSTPVLSKAVALVGELRSNDSFAGKEQADEVISKAIRAMGPKSVLEILPFNLTSPVAGKPGRAWLLPLMRVSVSNTSLAHFKEDLVPLSEVMFQRVLDHSGSQKTMEVKIFETLVQQIWSILPGYCDRPLDVPQAFDQAFAEQISKLLYQQPEMRHNLCRALQTLVDSLKAIADGEIQDDLLVQGRISRDHAQKSIAHLALFAPNLLAVLFNVYGETSPQHRGPILACIDSYLSITSAQELLTTFERVATMLETSMQDSAQQKEMRTANKDKNDNSTSPPISHALMDIIVTIAIYLPRDGFQSLFNVASIMLSQQNEPQLQKKAYKLLPRLAQSVSGRIALQQRNAELREMLLRNAESIMVSARKDRIQALSSLVECLPPQDLYFIPCILPEVILCTKETNERAREAAFNLLVQMGEKMQAGGTIDNAKVSHMPESASSVSASLEEYITMLSAGLAGSTPHMISASVTAISRVLFHFRASLSEAGIVDLVQTMDLFLKSPSREIVRSVLGFVKVCVISLPTALMLPRLQTLIPHLMAWSHEHKAQFRVKVKNIIERMIRRFGLQVVERNCPDEDKKLITNIRKTRERRKRKKTAAIAGEDDEEAAGQSREPARKAKFETEFDQAIYGSDSEDSSSPGSDGEDGGVTLRQRSTGQKSRDQKRGQTYIVEDEDEPLDLLDRKALGNISFTKPTRARQVPAKKRNEKTKMDEDGRLDLRVDQEGGDAEMVDVAGEPGDGTLAGGINAYVDAIRGRDAPHRGQRGKLKFSNKQSRAGEDGDDDGEREEKLSSKRGGMNGSAKGRGGANGSASATRGMGSKALGRGALSRSGGHGRGGKVGGKASQRRGLGVDKTRGGRVQKRSFDGPRR